MTLKTTDLRAVCNVMGKSLEILAERSGAVILGWVAEDVAYMGFVGHISARLGARCASRMCAMLDEGTRVQFFCNTGLARSFDFSARSALVRASLACRRNIESMTLLVSSADAASAAHAIAAVLDGPTAVSGSAEEFDTVLLKAAPLAHLRLHEIELTSLQGSARWRSSLVPTSAPAPLAERRSVDEPGGALTHRPVVRF